MNDKLDEIRKLIIEYSELLKEIKHMRNSNKYKCDNWDNYNEISVNNFQKLTNTRELLVEKCNEYLNYPVKKFLFFDFTKKVKLDDNNSIEEDMLCVPFVDKREYYCLIALLDSMSVLGKWFYDGYYFC